jgi:hypothetical protein
MCGSVEVAFLIGAGDRWVALCDRCGVEVVVGLESSGRAR